MSKGLIVLLKILSLLLVFIGPSYAEESFPLKTNLDIHVMPEYDTSEILILNAITYTNLSDEPYSGEIRFSVPKGTRNNIVIETINGQDRRATIRVEDKGEYAEFIWRPSIPIEPNSIYPIHLEYYYGSLPGTGNKSFRFNFIPGYPIETTKFYLYKPLKSSDFVVKPFANLLGTDNLGFNVYGVNYNNLKVGESITLDVSYLKTDPSPSVLPPGQGNNTGSQTIETQPGLSKYKVPLIIGIVIIATFAIIMVMRAQDRRRMEELIMTYKKHKGRLIDEDEDEDEDEDDLYELSMDEFEKEKEKLEEVFARGEIGEADFLERLSELEEEYGVN